MSPDTYLQALVFDAYGTLFDVHSVIRRCEELWPGRGQALSQLWRAKQLEYTWLRSLMQRYENFERITEDSLRHACAALKLACEPRHIAALMDEYLRLSTFPETQDALAALGDFKLAILSNGAPAMLQAVVGNAGLNTTIPTVLSVDSLAIYKPDPRVYQLVVDTLDVPPANIGFVSSNCWDACGAKSFGFTTFWVNRGGAPMDALGVTPDHIVQNLAGIPPLLKR
ncbi:MAG: haloacid dehalogenase type II [Betaproteobacteria bacterium]|nr:haloacid dehalogenase type II [Betaproteobacteria bacterium]